MLFDPRPKSRREDLYDREKELEAFNKALKVSPLIVVSGIRRLGKTSLVLVALKDKPHIIVDVRGVNPNSRMDLYKRIESAFNSFLSRNKKIGRILREKLKRISGVQIMGSGISISWKKERTDILDIFKILEENNVILVVDEVQNLRGVVGREFAEVLAHIYDYTKLKVVLTGSEVGLLYDFLGVENPRSPLYGRYFSEIKLKRFTR